ncbi:response regulator [Tolypothrix sp. LEGE 11397]|uniref:hybrid sensor histidine kinase/response regulator n=1 Tax=Tolypothrix sp. LEGE 11397 TaxID=2777971 RepID=UPI001882FED3|nr:response regulator [Tolypothrix sp. LEGE 11397]MBE9082595.1 response regulator [Tolypothrix sp. LEGE 11397]
MLPEQQQRILGYFIEEARDHLNTIEQGLLNLQSTLNDPEMINEVFRAAHSIKGGAAMLGLSSIQHTSHRLEDCFKVLKENPIQVDQKLESLFLGVSDTLKALLENLSGPFGLSEETANTLMSETEPVFQWLNEHLELLVQQASGGVDSRVAPAMQPAFADNSHTLTEIFMQRDFPVPEEESPLQKPTPVVTKANDNWGEFQAQVLQTLREMLQLFKQGTTQESRQNLQQTCHQLVILGETFNLPNWCKLCEAAENAIANPDNSYLTLAKIVITEIKKAQELVLKGKESEIVISQQLEVILSFPEVELFEISTDLPDESATGTTPFAKANTEAIANELAAPRLDNFVNTTNNNIASLPDLTAAVQQEKNIFTNKENYKPETSELFNLLPNNEDETVLTNHNLDPKGPEVGIAELNTLADLFEGEAPELDETWQQEEILDINAANKLGIEISTSNTEDADSDLADLLSFDEPTSVDESKQTIIQTEDFSLLFGENFLDKETPTQQPAQTSARNSDISNSSQNDINLNSSTNESLREFTKILQEYPGDIAPQDVVQDLLGLELDDNNLLSLGELNQPEASFDDLFSETANESLLEEISPINFPQPESLSLDNPFTDLGENSLLSTSESTVDDLFDPQATVARDYDLSAEDLSNFWNEESGAEPQLELGSRVEQDVAKALEESLFTASHDFLDDSQLAQSSVPLFDVEDFNLTFQSDDEQIDLMFEADTGDDLFADLTSDNTAISSTDANELPVTEIRSLIPEESDIYEGLSLHSSLPSTTLPPELDFTPEFTNQPSIDNTFSSSADNDLFNVINDNSSDNPQLLFENINTSQSTYIQLDPLAIRISETPELDLGDDLLTTADDLKLDFNESTEVQQRPHNLDLLSTADNLGLDFNESTEVQQRPQNLDLLSNVEIAETTNEDVSALDLDLGDELLATSADLELNFDEVAELSQPEANLDLLANVEIGETTNDAVTTLDLGDELLATSADLELNFGEVAELSQPEANLDLLANVETAETTNDEFATLDLGDDLLATSADLELNFGEVAELAQPEINLDLLANVETAETTNDGVAALDLGDDLLATSADLELNFGEVAELAQPENNLDLLANVETAETTNDEFATLDLGDDLLATADLELNFNEAAELAQPENNLDLLANVETAETTNDGVAALDLGDDLLATSADLELNFGEVAELAQPENNLDLLANVETAETTNDGVETLDLGDDLLATADLELNFSEVAELSQPENNLDLLANVETAETTNDGVAALDLGDDLLATSADLELNVNEAAELAQPEANLDLFTNVETAETTNDGVETLDLGDDLLATADLELNFGEVAELAQPENNLDLLANVETAETTNDEFATLDLGDDLLATSADLELNFGEVAELAQPENNLDLLANVETAETTNDEFATLDLGDDLLATSADLELNFGEVAELAQPEINSEILDTAETTVADSAELNLLDDLLTTETILQAETKLEDTANTQDTDAAMSTTGYAYANSIVELDVLDAANNLSASLENITQTDEVATITAAEAELDVPPSTPEDEFAELETLLEEELASPLPEEDFAALEALLDTDLNEEPSAAPLPVYPQQSQPPTAYNNASTAATSPELEDEFGDLEKLLAEADQTISHSPSIKSTPGKAARPATRRGARFEETMKVPVKQLDDMSNLVGELVVNRNTLEQDHERLRQSLDNLLIQVQQLSDVGARMQELYERSLLEASLLATRKHRESGASSSDSNSDRGFSELEMDRFTPFHTLSQEMIEMIVRVRESASDIDFVTEETERVARQFRQATTQLQEGLTRARMVPFSQAIDRLRRGVRDNAIKYGKQVELMIEGGDTLIDKMILDHLTDPLTHMLNNAIAHGIETPEVRQAAGKNPVGEIKIRAFHQGNQTVISVGDDGAGIDTEKIKAKALKLGMLTAEEAKTITRIEIYNLLFHSGFSIKDEADEISGRGVGMDIVRSEISEVRGTVSTDSVISKGTTFTIRLPLTLSICKALCCVSDKARIAFPMDGVEDTLDIPVKSIQHNADGQTFIAWRDTILPFRPLKELLAVNRQISRGSVYGGTRDDDMVSVVVVRSANNLLALQIDLVLSEQEIVIKQFEGPAPKPLGVAGATVLGDGRIMPIADVLEIMDIFQGRMSKQSSGLWQQKSAPTLPEVTIEKIDPTVLIVDDSITVRELLSLTFNKAGYRVEQARDGQEAWDKLRSGLPCDIVFCDIEMPRCDGLELLSRIQKDHNLNHLPIAMLTSRGADKHRQMAIQLGASGYFTKPYLEEALLEAAVRMLKGEKLILNTTA